MLLQNTQSSSFSVIKHQPMPIYYSKTYSIIQSRPCSSNLVYAPLISSMLLQASQSSSIQQCQFFLFKNTCYPPISSMLLQASQLSSIKQCQFLIPKQILSSNLVHAPPISAMLLQSRPCFFNLVHASPILSMLLQSRPCSSNLSHAPPISSMLL